MDNGSLGNDSTTKSSVTVKITIIDVNDNAPTFEQEHYSVNVSEALQNGQALPGLLMSVTDSDGVSIQPALCRPLLCLCVWPPLCVASMCGLLCMWLPLCVASSVCSLYE